MNTTTPSDLQQLNAFIDGELDLKSQLEFEARLRSDVVLRTQADRLRQLRTALREGAAYHAAPAALRQRLAAALAPAAAAAAAAAAPSAPRLWAGAATAVQRWLGGRPMVASLAMAAVLAVALNLAWMRLVSSDRVQGDVVASHVRATLGQRLVDVASSDRHTVKPWLSSKLDFSPPVTELPLPGSVFLGGRVDYVDGRPVAALAYRQGQHVVNAYLWPSDAKDGAVVFSAQRGFQIAHWTSGGMNHWVISDLGREEFTTVVGALETADVAR
jgi:anti-sigma factor RsiW